MHARCIVFGETMRLADVAVSVALAAAAVFISSQTLAPGVYLAALCAPALLLPQRRNITARRLGILCTVSLAPTALAWWGRSVYAAHQPFNSSGLFDGSLFANLAVFILNKGLFVNSIHSLTASLPEREVYSVCLVALAAIPMGAALSLDGWTALKVSFFALSLVLLTQVAFGFAGAAIGWWVLRFVRDRSASTVRRRPWISPLNYRRWLL